jgi:hypothetical protein
MTPRIAPQISTTRAWLARHARIALGGVIVAGAAVLAVSAAAVLALAVVTVVAILAILGALIYLFARIRFRKPSAAQGSAAQGPTAQGSGGFRTLEARRAGAGWTVDALSRFGG